MVTRGRPGPANPVNPASLVGYDRVIFLMVFGAGLRRVRFVPKLRNGGSGWFFAALGAAFFIYGVSQFFMTKRIGREIWGQERLIAL